MDSLRTAAKIQKRKSENIEDKDIKKLFSERHHGVAE